MAIDSKKGLAIAILAKAKPKGEESDAMPPESEGEPDAGALSAVEDLFEAFEAKDAQAFLEAFRNLKDLT